MRLKNILGTLENPETQRPYSRLFPEAPSERALDIVARGAWRGVIEYRVNESLYGISREHIGEILFPRMFTAPPSYDEEINARIFAEEEAVRIDREVERLRSEDHQLSRDDAYVTIEHNGPPPRTQIEAEEAMRRFFLFAIDCGEKKEWANVEKIFARIPQAIEQLEEDEQEYVRTFFKEVFSSYFTRALQDCSMRNDPWSVYNIIILIRKSPYLNEDLYHHFVQSALQKREFRAAFARMFLERIASSAYNHLWRECELFGLPMDALKEEIRTQCERELCEVLKRNGAKEFFRWLDFAIRQEIFSEEELSAIQSLRTAILEYACGLIGGNDQWPKEFRAFCEECRKAMICASEDIAGSLAVRAAAEKYLIASFAGGADSDALFSAANDIHHAGIMSRNDAVTLSQIRDIAVEFLRRVLTENTLTKTDDAASQEIKYLEIVEKYARIGIDTRSNFDHVPAIKAARDKIHTELT